MMLTIYRLMIIMGCLALNACYHLIYEAAKAIREAEMMAKKAEDMERKGTMTAVKSVCQGILLARTIIPMEHRRRVKNQNSMCRKCTDVEATYGVAE